MKDSILINISNKIYYSDHVHLKLCNSLTTYGPDVTFLPPASVVEVIKTEPSVCLCVCLLMYVVVRLKEDNMAIILFTVVLLYYNRITPCAFQQLSSRDP